jgi:integrase
MPRSYEMTWVPSRRLWRKVYRGKVYTVSCKQLRECGHEPLADTQEGSRIAANAWWNKKWFELEAQEKAARRPPLPLEDVIRATGADFYEDADKARAAAGYATPQEERAAVEWFAARHREMGLRVEVMPRPERTPTEQERQQILREAHEQAVIAFVRQYLLGGGALPPEITKKLPAVQLAALHALQGSQVAQDKTVDAQAAAWLKEQELRVAAGEISLGGFKNKKKWVGPLLDFVGRTTDMATITDSVLDAFETHCLERRAAHQRGDKGGWGAHFTRDVRVCVREFVRWLADRGSIGRPAYLTRRGRKLRLPAPEMRAWTPEEYKAALGLSMPWFRAVLLLGANAGFTQQDASDLLDSEVDWDAGYIQRRRSKEKHVKAAPVVRYRLWPSTLALLREVRTGGDRVLSTSAGNPIIREKMKDGRPVRSDSAAEYFEGLRKRMKKVMPSFDGTFKGVRKMAAQMLEGHKTYARFVGHFLGHASRDMAHQHYTPHDQALFDRAVMWLGKQLGQT